MKKPVILIFLLSLLNVSFGVSDPEIVVRLDHPIIGMEEQATVTVILDRKAKNITPPRSPDYDLVFAGESYNSQVTIINGMTQSKNSYIYTFLLTPRKTGTFSIGSFQIGLEGKNHTTAKNDMNIRVVRQPQRKSSGNPGDIFSEIDEFFHGRNRIPQINFVLEPKNPNPIQNQQVILEGYIVSSDKNSLNFQFSQVSDIRSDKCALFDISGSIQPAVTKLNGLYRKLVRRYVIYPIETGKILIAPPNIIAMTPFGQIQLKTDVIVLESGKIGTNSGLSYIGDLKISYELKNNRLEAGKNGELKLTMSGNGNLKVLSNPYEGLNLDGIFLSAPITENKFKEFRSNKAYFLQEIKYLVVTRKTGEYSIPPLMIKYRDDQGNPKTTEIPSLSVSVFDKDHPIAKHALVLRPMEKKNDFRYVLFHPITFLILSIFLILPLAAFIFGKQENRKKSDPEYARKIQAGNKFRKYFAQSKAKLDEKDYKGFYTSVQNGLIYLLSDRLDLSPGTPYRNLLAAMSEKGLPVKTIELFEEIWGTCNRSAYSPTESSGSHDEILINLKRFVDLLK